MGNKTDAPSESTMLLADEVVPIGDLAGQAMSDALGPVMDDGLLHGAVAPEPDGVLSHDPAAAAGGDFRAAVIGAAGELGAAGANTTTLVAFANPTVVAAEWARTDSVGQPIHEDAPAGALTNRPRCCDGGCAEAPAGRGLVADVSQVCLVQREQLTVATSADYYFGSDAIACRVTGRVACAAPTPQKLLRSVTITPPGP